MKCTDEYNKKYNLLLNQYNKGISHLKMKIPSPFIHPHFPNLHDFSSSVDHKRSKCCNCLAKGIFLNVCNRMYNLLFNQHIICIVYTYEEFRCKSHKCHLKLFLRLTIDSMCFDVQLYTKM